MRSDLPDLTADEQYPYVKLLDGVAIIGLSSAVPTPPPYSTGRVSRRQLDSLERILRHDDVRTRFSVVLVHHHLLPAPEHKLDYLRRLVNASAVREALREGGANLVLHGHNHHPRLQHLARPGSDDVVWISENGSTSQVDDNENYMAKYSLYEIGDAGLESFTRYIYDPSAQCFREWKSETPKIP
jgi:3',5'-cyclic AMP phosphodiesterase CpdA